jgi:hypothetical protein
MAKQKKKRSKVYTGADAKITRPSITRVTAVKRNRVQQWWLDNKRIAKPVLIAVGVILIVVWLIVELIRIASGNVA